MSKNKTQKRKPDFGAVFMSMAIMSMLEKNGNDEADLLAKALCNFLFREVIEDIHADGWISQGEMEKLNHESVNRARFFVDEIMGNENRLKGFLYMAYGCNEWDKSEPYKPLLDEVVNFDFTGRLINKMNDEGIKFSEVLKRNDVN